MHFEYPWVFLLIPLFLFCERRCPMQIDLLVFPHIDRIAKTTKRRSLMEALKWVAWGGLLLAVASPVSTRSFEPYLQSDRDIVLVFDGGRALDEKSRDLLRYFVKAHAADRIGLVAVDQKGLTLVPLTADRAWIGKIVETLPGDKKRGVSTYDALAGAIGLLEKEGAKRRIVILVTRGGNPKGTVPPSVVHKMVKFHHIILYIIDRGAKKDQAAPLETLARSSGGDYFKAKTPEDLKVIEAKLRLKEPPVKQKTPIVTKLYYYDYPLFVAAMALLGFLFLMNRSEVS